MRVDGRHADAEHDFRAALITAPGHQDAALSLAHMLREDGRLKAAIEVIEASLRTCTDDQAHLLVGLTFMRECGAHVKAQALAAAARVRWPRDAKLAAMGAEFALAAGDFTGALDAVHAALDGNPRDGMSWLRMAYCRRFETRNDADAQRLEQAWRSDALDPDSRICVGFALGKMLADVGERADAVSMLRESNAAAAARTLWHTADWHAFLNRRLAERPLPQAAGSPDYVPVFVVGLPRTGTTLTASLLGRDEQLRNRGELNWIDAMYRHLTAQGGLHNHAALKTVAGLVRAQLRQDDPPARWYLDKNPLNFRYLDLVAALFPNARVIHCRRGLRDTALSIWMQYFAHADLGFSYSFSDIRAFVDGHDRLMDHWRATLPLEFFDLKYEELITKPDETLRSLHRFLGMPDVGVKNIVPAAKQAITTESVRQARQPLYTGSIDRWRTYAEYLPELEQMFNESDG